MINEFETKVLKYISVKAPDKSTTGVSNAEICEALKLLPLDRDVDRALQKLRKRGYIALTSGRWALNIMASGA